MGKQRKVTTHCDNCQNDVGGRAELEVSVGKPAQVRRLRHLDFCSWRCLADYSMKQQGLK